MITIGLLTIAAAWAIYRRQQRDDQRARAAERVERLRRERAARERQARIDRRESWRTEHEETRLLLNNGDDIVYDVRDNGPFDLTAFSRVGLRPFATRAEQLAVRGFQPLRDPLMLVAAAANELAQTAVPEEALVLSAYTMGNVPADLSPRALEQRAVSQERARRRLAEAIESARGVLRDEWGA